MGATSPMPAFETVLSETEMLAVLEYIKSSWPKEIRDMQWQRSQQIIEFEQSQQELEKDN